MKSMKRTATTTTTATTVDTMGEQKNTGKEMVWGANPMMNSIKIPLPPQLPPPPSLLPPPPSYWGNNTNTNPMFKSTMPPPPPPPFRSAAAAAASTSNKHSNKARSRWKKIFRQNKVIRAFQKNRNKQQEKSPQDLSLEMVDVEVEMVDMMDNGSSSDVYILSAETNDIAGTFLK